MDQDELLRTVVAAFERLQVPYLVTGSIATIFYGEPRFTNDIDVVAQLTKRAIPLLLAAFPPPAFYLSPKSVERAVASHRQFNIIHPASGLKIDVMIPAMSDHDRSRFARGRRLHPAPDYAATFAAPEDVILKKLEYYLAGGSEKHLRDIAAVLAVTPEIDRTYIATWAERLGVVSAWKTVEARDFGRRGSNRT